MSLVQMSLAGVGGIFRVLQSNALLVRADDFGVDFLYR